MSGRDAVLLAMAREPHWITWGPELRVFVHEQIGVELTPCEYAATVEGLLAEGLVEVEYLTRYPVELRLTRQGLAEARLLAETADAR